MVQRSGVRCLDCFSAYYGPMLFFNNGGGGGGGGGH